MLGLAEMVSDMIASNVTPVHPVGIWLKPTTTRRYSQINFSFGVFVL